MLLANRRVAEFCARRKVRTRSVPRTMVFRVHDTPSEEKLDRFRTFILRFGRIFKASRGRAIAREMNKLLAEVKGTSEENVVSTMAVRSMAKAFYTTDNIGHYGLAFPYYTHFTSPIRRFPDMMVHRLVAATSTAASRPTGRSSKSSAPTPRTARSWLRRQNAPRSSTRWSNS